MKNLTKLGLIFGVGTIAALTVGGCSSDDPVTPGGAGTAAGGTAPTAGTPAGGTAPTAGTPATGGTATAGTAAGGTATAGTAAGGTATAGTSTGGTGGSSGGTGGSSGGTGGSSGGSGGAGGGGGGAPSADCTKWCSGDSGLIKKCMGSPLLNPLVDSEQKCIAHCTGGTSTGAMGLACWITHTGNVKMASDQDPHCGHASGLATKAGPCNEITQ